MADRQNPIVALAFSELFKIAEAELPELKKAGERFSIEAFDAYLTREIPKVVANDKKDGWSNTKSGDTHNDYTRPDGSEASVLEKRIDNMQFLFGKVLPGKITDKIRDFSSEDATPIVYERLVKEDNLDPDAETIATYVKETIVALADAGLKGMIDNV
jgi:hypothetical protein